MNIKQTQKLILGYWGLPGRAQPARYLLEISGAKYEDKRYVQPADWFGKDKFALGLPFPNLPYLIDGENVKLTESETIFDYLVQKLKRTELLGQEADKYTVDLLRNLFNELGTKLYYYSIKEAQEKEQISNEQIIPKVRYVHSFLSDKDYLLGYFTVADLYFLSNIRNFKRLLPEPYKEFEGTFEPLLNRLQSIPQIASYISSGRHP